MLFFFADSWELFLRRYEIFIERLVVVFCTFDVAYLFNIKERLLIKGLHERATKMHFSHFMWYLRDWKDQ